MRTIKAVLVGLLIAAGLGTAAVAADARPSRAPMPISTDAGTTFNTAKSSTDIGSVRIIMDLPA